MITVVTSSIPERADLLAEAKASVDAQTVRPATHLIGVDFEHGRAARVLNQLVGAVKTEWVMVLDDDDLLDRNHIETISKALGGRCADDVVYSRCDFSGGTWPPYNEPFSRQGLKEHSIVPMTAAFHRDAWEAVGGFEEGPRDYDWRFWKTLSELGMNFVALEEVTWCYRFAVRPGHVNNSRGDIDRSRQIS